MTVGRTWGVVLTGLQGDLVEVEADLSNQTPNFTIIGLADKAIGEAHQRVHNACANSGLPLPRRKLTVNLSPASLPKHGSALDLAIAIAALAQVLVAQLNEADAAGKAAAAMTGRTDAAGSGRTQFEGFGDTLAATTRAAEDGRAPRRAS